MFGVD